MGNTLISAPQRRHLRPCYCSIPGKWSRWHWEVIRVRETVPSPNNYSPEMLAPGKGTKRMPRQVCTFAKYPRTWVAKIWEVHKTQGPLWTVPLQSTLEPEKWGPKRHMPLWPGQTQCGPYTVSTPHTCHLFTVSLPSHNTTEQVSPNKWPPLPPCVRVEIRYWSDV